MKLNQVESQGDQTAFWLHRLEQGGEFDIPSTTNVPFLTALAESQGMTREDAAQYLRTRGLDAFRKRKE